MLRKSILIVLLLGLIFPVHGQEFAKVGTMGAQFLKIDLDARSVAMASASMATCGDVGAIFRNPAGLIHVQNSGFIASYAPWFVDINLYGAGFAHNFGPYGVFGVHFIYLDSGEMEETTVDQQQGTGQMFKVTDLALGISYARRLTDKFAIGGNLRWIHEDLWVSATSVFGVDLGLLYDTGYKSLRLGMTIKNFGSKFSLPDTYQDYDNGTPLTQPSDYLEYDLPVEFAFGLAMEPWKTAAQRITLALDGIHPSDNYERVQLGAEYAYMETAFLRAGYIFRHDTAGINAGAGISVPMSGYHLGIDYAFSNFTILDNTHRFSLRFSF
ncbi:MAG: PorV/PorQ family protein [bacterium]